MTGKDEISTKELIETRFALQEQLCESRMAASSAQISSSIEALEKRFDVIFSAMDKAVIKAETAQREYNEKTNNLRGAMDDAAKLMMPRAEVQLVMKGVNDRLDRMQGDITGLRDFRSETGGRGSSRHETWGYAVGLVALLFSLASIVLLVVREIRFG